MPVSRQERSLAACARVREWLPEYDYGALGPWRRWQATRHLARCPECARELAALRRATELLTALPAPPAPEAMWEHLKAEIEATEQVAPVAPLFRRRAPLLVTAAAVAALALGIGLRAPEPMPETAAHPASYVESHLALSHTRALAPGAGVDAFVLLTAGKER